MWHSRAAEVIMIRNVGAVLAGLIVGSAVNMAFILLNTMVLFPMPAGTSMNDPAQMQAYIAGLPAAAFLVVIVAHLGQSFVGGWVAARLGGSRPVPLALIIGVLSLVGGVINLLSLHGPLWMWVEVPLYLVVAWLAGGLEQRRRAG
jgi:hypothetical protein